MEKRSGLAPLLGGLVLAVLVGCAPQGGKTDLKALARGEMDKLVVSEAPAAPPPTVIIAPDGAKTTLAAFKGKVTVVNLWATWCAPCKIEMPTLAKLQQAYAGKPLVVVPISMDRGEALPQARTFIAGLPPLTFYSADIGMAFELKPPPAGFPATLILDKQGRERARLPGDADWSSKEAKAVIDALLAEPA